MPTTLTDVPETIVPQDPPRKFWTREDCEFLERSGWLAGKHYELVDGELINKMGKKRPHVNSLTLIHEWLVQVFGARFVNSEAPIDVAPEDNPTNEPEPDLIVLKRDSTTIRSANPRPEELWLAVEISETTLYFDLKTKARLYARAGVPEYWVLDLTRRKLIVHSDPKQGKYTSVVEYSGGESVAPLGAPNSLFRVADAFPA